MDVVLCQFGNMIGDNVYLPYSIGCIVSYCKPKTKDINYKMLYIKKDINTILDEIGTPDVLAMSSYIWNHQYNLRIAKLINIKNPQTTIIFGGHEINGFDKDIFQKYPFIDFVVNGEGEYTFYKILQSLKGENHFFYNHTINMGGSAMILKQKNDFIDINDIPSPYLTDIFDDIMKEKYNFTASLETNRGCPYQCYYCDWGNHKVTNKKMRLFNEDRVNAEIEWFGKNKIDFVFGCDSNYGFYGKRDMKFIDEIIETKKTYGFPNKFRVCYTKNSDETIFKMNKKLNEFNLSKGATISFQSFNKQTLKAVKRKNMGIQDFQKYILMYNKENIPVYTELILGLPEETYESFKEGFNILLNNMQHSNIVVYYCQVLENSKLNEKEYKEKYDIKISKIPMYATHTKFEKDQIFEYENIVVKTEKMFRTDWVWSCMFSWSVQTFHCLGLTQYIAIHLKYVYGIEYKDFYTNLIYLEFNNSINLIKNEYFKVMHIFNQVAVEKGSFKYIVDDINWPIEEGSFLHFIDNFDLFYLEIVEFLFKKYPEIAKNKEITELINFNKYMLCKYNDKIFHMKMNYSFVDIFEKYFETGKYEFEECKNRTYYPATKKYKNFKDFAINVVWYGRKGGKTFKNLNDIKVEYIK